MCYHFMILKPIDSHGSLSSLPCLYLILFAIAYLIELTILARQYFLGFNFCHFERRN